MDLDDEDLTALAQRLCAVPGVVGVVLGGSRARGAHTPESDYDLGVYYRRPLDVSALGELARDVAGPQAWVTDLGEWGPWVDGGAWLTIADTKVDWLYRDVDRVIDVWSKVQNGWYAFAAQNGHPFGFANFAYVGELTLGVVLADPTGELAALRFVVQDYPPALRDALVGRLWEANIDIDIARKAVGRADTSYVAGCVFRAVVVCAHALHGNAKRWLVNEKGAVAAAGDLPGAPENFTRRAHFALGHLGTTPAELTRALDSVAELVRETIVSCNHGAPAAAAAPGPKLRVAASNPFLWEQHCCLPLQPSADIAELARYPTGSYLSVNIGYSPHSKAQATMLAHVLRHKALVDGRFRPVQVFDDLAAAADEGAIALAFDLEDANPLEGDLTNVAHFYDLGVRSLLPSYNHANTAGCGCLDADDTGLTAYGRDLVREMNRVGMLVDGSHCSVRTGLDLSAATTQPMIYSHSNFRGLWQHPRNITDEQARECARTGGVVGINGVGIFLGVNDPELNGRRIEAMADHIEFGIELVGIDHIGIGSDYSFDHVDFNHEMATNPQAFSDAYTSWGPLQWVPPEGVLTLPDVLRRRGFDEISIAAVFGGNFARVADQVWA